MSEKNGKKIDFKCVHVNCNTMIPIEFQKSNKLRCSTCKNEYSFNENLVDQIRKFERLVTAVQDAKDILGQTAVAVDIPGHSVKVPYKLLLTRLNTLLTLKVNGEELKIQFRVEPLEAQIVK